MEKRHLSDLLMRDLQRAKYGQQKHWKIDLLMQLWRFLKVLDPGDSATQKSQIFLLEAKEWIPPNFPRACAF